MAVSHLQCQMCPESPESFVLAVAEQAASINVVRSIVEFFSDIVDCYVAGWNKGNLY